MARDLCADTAYRLDTIRYYDMLVAVFPCIGNQCGVEAPPDDTRAPLAEKVLG